MRPKGAMRVGQKKIKTPCGGVSKSNNPSCLFICSHCQVSGNVSKSGVWLAPNGLGYEQKRVAGNEFVRQDNFVDVTVCWFST